MQWLILDSQRLQQNDRHQNRNFRTFFLGRRFFLWEEWTLVNIDFLFGNLPYHETNCNQKVQKAFAFSSWGLKNSFFGHFGGIPLILNHQLGLGWVGCINDATTLLSRTFANVIFGMLFFYVRYLPKLPNSSTIVGTAFYQLKVLWSFKSRVIIMTPT